MEAVLIHEANIDAVHSKNNAAFLRLDRSIFKKHYGEFALLADGELCDFFKTINDALDRAAELGHRGKYSIMRVESQPIDMGFFDCAAHSR